MDNLTPSDTSPSMLLADLITDSSPESNCSSATEDQILQDVEKLQPRVKKVVLTQLAELVDSEKRCDTNIKEMEKLLNIMIKEKQDISAEREKLQNMIETTETSSVTPLPVNFSLATE